MALTLRLLSVNVAQPQVLGEKNGMPLFSAIAKKPVTSATITVGRTNLGGDAQANLEKHGGPDKAVYAYVADHWGWWKRKKNFPCRAGAFGENLTLMGADETGICIGDRFSWGDTELQITQPRVPCSKFQLYSGRKDAGAAMTLSGRCGWYFRVTNPGRAPVEDASLIRITGGQGPSVREAFAAAFDPQFDSAHRMVIAQLPSLSEAWRRRLQADEA